MQTNMMLLNHAGRALLENDQIRQSFDEAELTKNRPAVLEHVLLKLDLETL